MNKYEITVTEILEDGTRKPFAFDEGDKHTRVTCEGFAIIGVCCEDDATCTAIHNMNTLDLAGAIAGNPHLRAASVLGPILHRVAEEAESDAAE